VSGVLVELSFSFEALTSVAGGVNMFSCAARGPTASLLCCFEKVGYGRLDLDSVFSSRFSSSSEMMPGIDARLGELSELSDVRDVDFSFEDVLREECDLCRRFRSLSSVEDSLRSRCRSGLLSRSFEGILNAVHHAKSSRGLWALRLRVRWGGTRLGDLLRFAAGATVAWW
jgi:hypothetical protein